MAEQTIAPTERGRLDVRHRVLTRIVEQAVRGLGASSERTSALGEGVGRLTGQQLPRAEVRVVGRAVHLHVEVGCAWPRPVAAFAEQVRTTLREEVRRQTGLDVRTLEVVVHPLVVATGGGRVA